MTHRRIHLLSVITLVSLWTTLLPPMRVADAAPVPATSPAAAAFTANQPAPTAPPELPTAVPVPPLPNQPEEAPAEFADEPRAAVLPPEFAGPPMIYLPLMSGVPRVEVDRPLLRVDGAQTTTTFAASDDAYVREKYPSSTYNSNSYLRAYQTTGDNYASYLRFTVAGLNGTVQQATLRLYVTNGTSNGPALSATASTWTESSLTWGTRPATIGGIVANAGTIGDNVWVEYDVTNLVTGDGTYSVLLDPESSNGLTADSREGAQPPQLVVSTTSTAATATTTSVPPTATNTPASATTTPTNTPTPTSGNTATPTSSPTATLPPSGTRLKTITFEDGSLTDATTGADSTVGSVLLETSAPLAGSASATMNNTTSTYLVEEFAATDTVYLTFLLRVNTIPSSTTIIAQFRDSSTSYGNLQVTSSGKLRLRKGSTTVGSDSPALAAGTLYRVGLRQTRQSGSSANGTLQAFVVAGDSAFGNAFAQSSTQSLPAAVNRAWIGSINSSSAVRITMDNLALDTAGFAPPSGSMPTATPIPTATPPSTCNDAFEPNDTRVQAKSIQANETQQHMLCQSSTGDFDWVSFQATAGEVYAFQTTKADDCSITTPLYLYKGNETSWIGAVFDDDCTGATLTIRLPESTMYYLRIGSALNGNAPAAVPYTLRVLADPCNDNYEPDESQAQAKTLVVGEIQSHVICLQNDQDWLRLDLIAGWTYTIDTFNLSSVADTHLGLYRDGSTLPFLLNDNVNASTKASQLIYTPSTSGPYYLNVTSAKSWKYGIRHTYDLRITGQKICIEGNDLFELDDTVDLATSIEVNSTKTMGVCYPLGNSNDTDWLRFTVLKDGVYRVETLNVSANIGTYIFLYTPDGQTKLAEGTGQPDNTGRWPRSMELPLQAGQYAIRVNNAVRQGTNEWTYDVRVTEIAAEGVATRPEVPHLTPTPLGPTASPTPTPAPEILATAEAIRTGINQERTSRGLAPLASNESLNTAAQAHSDDMAQYNVFTHTGSDGSSSRDRARQAGYAGQVGENIARGSYAFDPVQAWMSSFGHRQNILNPRHRDVGAGAAVRDYKYYNTSVLGIPSDRITVFINNDTPTSTSRAVTLTLPLPEGSSAPVQVMFSDSPSFSGAQWATITPTISVLQDPVLGPITSTVPLTRAWNLPAGNGQRSVYAALKTAGNTVSYGKDTIILIPPAPTDATMPPLPAAMNYQQSAGAVGAVTLDHPLIAPGGLLPPALALRYNSFVADEGRARQSGATGSGTTLGEYAILRRPDTTPNDTDDDSFVLLWGDTLTPLVYADPAQGGDGFYHRAREQAGDAWQIRRVTGAAHGVDGGEAWDIRDRAGTLWRLGATADSAWRYVSSGSTRHVYRWNLDRVDDLHGNYQTWSYSTEPGTLNGAAFERGGYLAEIAWNGHAGTNQAPDRRFVFSYAARTSGTPDYDLAARFYLAKRLATIEARVGNARVWDYAFGYDVVNDGAYQRLLLRSLTRHGRDGTPVLATLGLTYQPPPTAGEGYHLASVSDNGTLRVSYSYERFLLDGQPRYRQKTTTWATAASAPTGSARTRLVSTRAQSAGGVQRNHSWGGIEHYPDGSWGFGWHTIDNGAGDRYETRYRDQGDFAGLPYKQFCQTNGAGTNARGVDGSLRPAANGGSGICHEQVNNYDAASIFSGVARIQVPSTFEDIRQPDGSYQKLQTNYTYTSDGVVRYEDRYGEQGTPADDRFIERDHDNADFPDLVTEERTRNTLGQLVARTIYRYQPGTRLIAEEGRWLLEESRPLTTTFTYNARGLLATQTDPLGHTTSSTYDAAGNRETVTDALGNVTSSSYDTLGRLLTTTDPRGAVTSYSYDPITNALQTTTDALGGVTTYQYDSRTRKIAETDALGRTTRYGYNDLDQLVVMTDTLGFATRYEYDTQGQQAALVNPLGQRATMQYDRANGWLTQTRDPLGNPTTMQYDGAGRVTAMIDARGGRTQTEYDGFGRVVATIDPLGNRVTRQYDALDRLVTTTDALSQTTRYQYDSLSRMRVMTDTLGFVTPYTYDDAGRETATTDPRGHTSSSSYDALGRLVASTDAVSQTTRYGYDAAGNQTIMTDTLGFATRSQYDLLGRQTRMTDALNHSTGYGYDAVGNQTVLTDTLGFVTRSSYDAANRLIASTDALNHVTRYGYDAVGNTTVITDARGFATQLSYDAANRRAATTDPLNQTARAGYDAVGHQTVLTDTTGVTSTLTYDLAGRVTAMTDGLGRATQQQYDAAGRLIRRTRPDGVATTFAYDAAGRLTAVVENARDGVAADHETNVRTTYDYDPNGNLLSMTDANGHTQRFEYDALNRQVRASDPLSNTQQLFYTARGELDRSTDALGRTTSYSYDALRRVTEIQRPDATVQFGYDPLGRRTVMTDTLGVTRMMYDSIGRIQSLTDPFNQQVGYGYDASGNRTSLTYPGNRQVTYRYDALNRLTQVLDGANEVASYTYTAANRLEQVTRANGATSTYTYDDAGQVREIAYSTPTATLARFSYTYDPAGNRATTTEQLPGGTTTLTYTYDLLHRLAGASGSDGSSFSYRYDAAGNRVEARDSTSTTTSTYDAANRITSANGHTYTYDANGNLLNDGTHNYTYNVAGQVTSMTQGGATTSYGYNGDGVLLTQTAGATTTRYTQDQAAPLSQVLQSTQDGATTDYLYGLERLAAVQGSTRTWYAGDALGSVRQTLDDSGTVLGNQSYDPWGVPQGGSLIAPFGFTGELQQGSDVYLRARWYNSQRGVFNSRDPFAGFPEQPITQHRYLYGNGNPLSYRDPSGFSGARDGGGDDGPSVPCSMFTPQPGQPAGDCIPDGPWPTPSPTPSPMPSPTPTPTSTLTPSPNPSPSPSSTPSPTPSPMPSPTPTVVPPTVCPPNWQIRLPPIDIGYIIGIGGTVALQAGPGGGFELVYDLYDFEVDTFAYGGIAAGLNVGASVYMGVMTGWSYYDTINQLGVENYRGPFGGAGGGVGLVSGQVFWGTPANPNDPTSGRLKGVSVGGGWSWGGKKWNLPGSAGGGAMWYYTAGDVMQWFGLGNGHSKRTFHRDGFHKQTMRDAVEFAAYLTIAAQPIASQMIPYVFYNGVAWESQR